MTAGFFFEQEVIAIKEILPAAFVGIKGGIEFLIVLYKKRMVLQIVGKKSISALEW